MPRQFQGIPLEGLGVGSPGIGEANFHLAGHSTGLAGNSWNRQDEKRCSVADRQRSEPPLGTPSGLNVARATRLTPDGLGLLINGEDHVAILVGDADILVAPDREGMIQ